jgi:hypothetical protein
MGWATLSTSPEMMAIPGNTQLLPLHAARPAPTCEFQLQRQKIVLLIVLQKNRKKKKGRELLHIIVEAW